MECCQNLIPEEVQIGEVYKVSLPHASGRFIVKRVYENKKGNWEAECIPEEDRKIRFPEQRVFYVKDLQTIERKVKSVAKRVEAEKVRKLEVNSFSDLEFWQVKVTYWPPRKGS